MSAGTATAKVADIKVREDFNVRENIGDIDWLTTSIQELGVLVPLVVEKDGKDTYVVSGHRRLAAAQQAGLDEVPVTYHQGNGAQRDAVAGAENIARANLNVVEEAKAYRRLTQAGMSDEQAQRALGVSPQRVAQWRQILAMGERWWPFVVGGHMSWKDIRFVADLKERFPRLEDILYDHNVPTKAELKSGDYEIRTDSWALYHAASDAKDMWAIGGYTHADVGPLKLKKALVDKMRDELVHIDRYGGYEYRKEYQTDWSDEDLMPLRAAGVLWESEDTGYGRDYAICTDTAMFKQAIEQIVERAKKPTKAKADKPELSDKEKTAKQKLADKRKAIRERIADLRATARDQNKDLWVALAGVEKQATTPAGLSILMSAALEHDERHAYTPYVDCYSIEGLALQGFRYCHPSGTRTETTKSGKVKVSYYDITDEVAEGKARTIVDACATWISAGKSVELRAGRVLWLICAAALCNELVGEKKSEVSPFRDRSGYTHDLAKSVGILSKGCVPRGMQKTRTDLEQALKEYDSTLPNRGSR